MADTIQRQITKLEFYAYPNINFNWAAALVNPFAAGNLSDFSVNPAKAQIVTCGLNPNLTKKRIFGYIYAAATVDPASNFCFFLCRISFYLAGRAVKRMPLYYLLGNKNYNFPLDPAIIKADTSFGVISSSQITLPVSSADVPDENSIAAKLFIPIVRGNPNSPPLSFNPEPTDQIVMHSQEEDFQADRMDVDALGWGNVDPNYFRVLVAVDEL